MNEEAKFPASTVQFGSVISFGVYAFLELPFSTKRFHVITQISRGIDDDATRLDVSDGNSRARNIGKTFNWL